MWVGCPCCVIVLISTQRVAGQRDLRAYPFKVYKHRRLRPSHGHHPRNLVYSETPTLFVKDINHDPEFLTAGFPHDMPFGGPPSLWGQATFPSPESSGAAGVYPASEGRNGNRGGRMAYDYEDQDRQVAKEEDSHDRQGLGYAQILLSDHQKHHAERRSTSQNRTAMNYLSAGERSRLTCRSLSVMDKWN